MLSYFRMFAERFKSNLLNDPIDTEAKTYLDWYFSQGIYRNNKPSPYIRERDISNAKGKNHNLHTE